MTTNTIPPLTPSAVEQLRTLIESAATIESPMREWELSLACGHTIRYRQHASLHAPDAPTWSCADCGHLRRLTGSIPADDVRERVWRLRETHIEHRRALDEVARLKRQLARAERRVTAARSSLLGMRDDFEPLGGVSAARGEIDVMDELAEYRPA